MSASTYLRDARLNWMRGTAHPAVPGGGFFVSLHSADPGVTGASELSGNAYARAAIAAATGSWAAPATNGAVRQITNAVAVTWAAASGAWTAATHFGIWDAVSAGNFIRGGALAVTKTVQSGDTATANIGDLILTES